MIVKNIVKKNEYRDSIFLMRISERIGNAEGLEQAAVLMGTETNKSVLTDLGLFTEESKEATSNDMIIAIEAVDQEVIEKTLVEIKALLEEKRKTDGDITHRTLETAIKAMPDANLALISVPGEFAAGQAKKALENGLHVFIFSDNMPIAEEAEIKKTAREKGLLVMGSDCGVALINNIALATASVARPGPVGVVGASGSGLQEITVLVERAGLGISQAIGTGGRDLSKEVGGITMLQGIDLLEQDEDTQVIVLVSKPPYPATRDKILDRVSKCKKPVIVNFLGGDSKPVSEKGAIPALTLEEAASVAVNLVKKQEGRCKEFSLSDDELESIVLKETKQFSNTQKYMRGVFCGGTFCEEAILVLEDIIGKIYSNTSLRPQMRLARAKLTKEHSLIDMGDEEFTKGRPHPVIDPEPCCWKIIEEAGKKDVAVILIDVILGYGVHPDPAGLLGKAVTLAKEIAREQSRHLSVIGSVCGTENDPQCLSVQEKKLREAGAVLVPSNAQAACLAGMIIKRINNSG